jgi:hypothetical protein
MHTIVINKSDVDKVSICLKEGGVVAFPTETGIWCCGYIWK